MNPQKGERRLRQIKLNQLARIQCPPAVNNCKISPVDWS